MAPDMQEPRFPLVPCGFLAQLPLALRPALKWLAQKDSLAQDMLLLTSPAERTRARLLALAYAELVNAEVEYVGISADTTEADLKQRREILSGGSVAFSDSPPVKAALEGSILVLDGLERAERNVLPTLNNLLENREMSLEDGRFLIEAHRYQLLKPLQVDHESGTRSNACSTSRLAAVHPNFRVVALASPCPPFDGRALDPPLRSRFQSLLIPSAPAEELASSLRGPLGANAESVVMAAEAIMELERQSIHHNTAFFSFSSSALQRYCSRKPAQPDALRILQRVYPPLEYGELSPLAASQVNQALLQLGMDANTRESGKEGAQMMSCGHYRTAELDATARAIQADMAAGNNILLVAHRGAGKSALIRSLRLETWQTFNLHRDLTARDLLQRRVTDEVSGESAWADQPVANAARTGEVVVLDGVHRLPAGALVAAFGRLCSERELDLPDGTRLVDNACEGEATVGRKQKLAGSFRLVALAEPGSWLSPEVAALFSTHFLPEMMPAEIGEALPLLVPTATPKLCQDIVCMASAALATQSDTSFSERERDLMRLSFRVLLRIVCQAAISPDRGSLPKIVHNTMMSRFWPVRLREAMEGWLKPIEREYAISTSKHAIERDVSDFDEDALLIGLQVTRRSPQRPELVPAPRSFFSSPAAVSAVRQILICEEAGEHAVLLLGNQGVGKNVAADRALQLLQAEREYVQLHRDTTVSSLTVRPVLQNGRLRYEDAPLVRAAKHGRVCVLDEADKAPIEVVIILKALVEDGELLLGDGRRLCRKRNRPSDILINPDFRLWVLANRPGFPFHGNHFFRECGDVFAAIVLDNPDISSETALLHHIAPTYPKRQILDKLALAFAELRKLAESTAISYPYSMREAIAVARHLEKFPKESVADALSNVLTYEAFDPPLLRQLLHVFDSQGLRVEELKAVFNTVSGDKGSRSLKAADIEIRYYPAHGGGRSTPRTPTQQPKHGEVDPTGAPHVGGNRWAGGSGGSDTAGLGGRGGPYRLWDGNPVFQVDDAMKKVSSESKSKARALARQAWQNRLEDIEKMDPNMWALYEDILCNVEPQVAQLRAIFRDAKDKKTERIWKRNCSDGELDDTRLVEGIAGERSVYKKRGEAEVRNQLGENTRRQKRRLCFVMDCSGSMYRFNSLDGRLNRMLEATCLILESMEGHTNFDYAILGHSGESAHIPFVCFGHPPANRGERLKILQKMLAHSQFCFPGDNTIEATDAAIDYVLQDFSVEPEREKQAFVVVISDANFRRYGLDPIWWSNSLRRSSRVDGHAVMIGSIGEEASTIRDALPPGQGHVVLDTALLPSVFRSIFEQAGMICDEL
ncbi:unnamed protein product [Symbiodinium microadriaticum]|nr:unnamed protein product [Symbiodinium microadriaticum]